MALIIDLARAGDTQGLIALKEREGANFNPNIIEKGLSALHMAINKRHIGTALWLINEAKADINVALPDTAKDLAGFTPLFLAIEMHNPNDPDLAQRLDMTPVINALLNHPSLDISKILQGNKSYPGYTVLLLAINQKKAGVAKVIINSPKGSLILSTASRSGMTPYFKALEVAKHITDPTLLREMNEITRLLAEKNAHRPAVMSRSAAPTPVGTTPAASPTQTRRATSSTTSSTASVVASPTNNTTTSDTLLQPQSVASVAIDIPAATEATTATTLTTGAIIPHTQQNTAAPQSSTTANILWFLGAAANVVVTAVQTISHYTRRAAAAADTGLNNNPQIHVGADLEAATNFAVMSSPKRPAPLSISTSSSSSATTTQQDDNVAATTIDITRPATSAPPSKCF